MPQVTEETIHPDEYLALCLEGHRNGTLKVSVEDEALLLEFEAEQDIARLTDAPILGCGIS